MNRPARFACALAQMFLIAFVTALGVYEGGKQLFEWGFQGFDLIIILMVSGYACCYFGMHLVLKVDNWLKNLGKHNGLGPG